MTAPAGRHRYPGTAIVATAGDRVHVWGATNYHVGTVTSVDQAAGTITVVDGDHIVTAPIAKVIHAEAGHAFTGPHPLPYRSMRSDVVDGVLLICGLAGVATMLTGAAAIAWFGGRLVWRLIERVAG